MKASLHNKRKNYTKNQINFLEFPKEPMELFANWYKAAEKTEPEANACTLATANHLAKPRARVVLLKEFNAQGFVFYSNKLSAKGRAMAQNPSVCLSFLWLSQEKQVIVEGEVENLLQEESAEYFAKRPMDSQLGAILSKQSQSLELDFDMDAAFNQIKKTYKNQTIQMPSHWGGYVVVPNSIEFWQGRPNRLHDRLVYTKDGNNWKTKRLWP